MRSGGDDQNGFNSREIGWIITHIFEDRITIPYKGENVTYSELYEKEPFGCGCFLADIDNDYQDEIVFVEDSVQKPYLVLDHALDGSIQEMDISEDIYVFYYNNQRITEKQYEAILSKYYNNDTREDLGNLVEEAYR